MAKVYTAVFYRAVSDEAARAAYAELAGPAIVAAGGRVLAAGTPLAIKEAGLDQRSLIIAWDSLEQALAVYESEPYKAALRALGATAERDIRILAALD